ncbi:MAG: NAD-dependent epimerase/dehydratase family protein [Kiritimatiellia bacterium]|jgi:nucleoside-diphosphate-sugar epimerase
MKVLVTGGTGFTGKALVRRLLDLGHQVVCMDYKPGVAAGIDTAAEIRRWGAEVVLDPQGVTNRECVARCMRGVDYVQHVAAAFREMDVPESYYDDVNVGGTRICLEEAVKAGVKKFVYCSTCGVHGNVLDPPTDEDHNIAPADYYQMSKYKAEPITLDFAKSGKIKASIVRPSAIYGPGDPERFNLIFRRVAKGVFPMIGDGQTLYHPVYIDNLVDVFVLAMDPSNEKSNGRAYLAADAEYVTIEDLVLRTAKAMGVPVKFRRYPLWPVVAAGHIVQAVCKPLRIAPPIHPRRVDWFRQNRAFDITRARVELGYDPKVGLDEGLRRTFEWYRDKGLLR